MSDRDEPYFGWIRGAEDKSDLNDDRSESFDSLDRRFGPSGKVKTTRGAVTLRPWMPPICDQGDLQSCTAHALAAAMGFEHQGLRASRLQLYYFSRSYERRTSIDSGARLHNAIRSLRDYGVAPEKDWPYDQSKVTDQPNRGAASTAGEHKISRYAALSGGAEYRLCLERGYPFVIGIHHTDDFWSDRSQATGMIYTPGPDEPALHSHAVCVIGYAQPCSRARDYAPKNQPDSGGLYYEIRNSAGPDWGDEGHFWVPADYLENPRLAGDAWTIRK